MTKATAAAWKQEPVSERQLKYIESLVERKLQNGSASYIKTKECVEKKVKADGTPMTKGYASIVIEKLKAFPDCLQTTDTKAKVKPTADAVKITEGIWKMGEDLYKVQLAAYGSGRLYAKRLQLVWKDGNEPLTAEELEWFSDPEVAAEYKKGGTNEGQIVGKFIKETGAITTLRKPENGATKLEKDDATKFGQLYGVCCCCGRLLTDETSIEMGIGPICASKYF